MYSKFIPDNSKINRKKKVFYFFLLLLILLFPITLLPYINIARTLLSLKEITPGSLYIMNYYSNYKFNKYLKSGNEDFQQLFQFINKNLLSSSDFHPSVDTNWACSAFSVFNTKGEPIYARNLDIPGKHPALILRTKPYKGYSSLTMVELTSLGYSSNNKELAESLSTYKDRESLLAAPYMPRDGINEHGLVVATLNAPFQIISKNPDKISLGR
jgi:hypothetical protein